MKIWFSEVYIIQVTSTFSIGSTNLAFSTNLRFSVIDCYTVHYKLHHTTAKGLPLHYTNGLSSHYC